MRPCVRWSFVSSRSLAGLLFLGLLPVVAGCSKGSTRAVNPVRGRVLLEGNRPVGQAVVTFHPVAGSGADTREPVPSARTDDQGNFSLTSYASGDGAPEGEYVVTVTWFRSYATSPSGDEATVANFLPPGYANPASSRLRATVRAGDNELPPLIVSAR